MNASFRKKLLQFHTWTGLTVGLVIVFLAVTGASFVLRPQLDDIVYGNLRVVPACDARLPLDTLAANARAVHPAAKLHSFEVTAERESSLVVKFTDGDMVYMNPCTGKVLGIQNEYGGFFGIVNWLHRFKFIDEGRLVAGWFNVVFLTLLIIGGFALWWPRKGHSVKNALKFNPRLPGAARTINLHKVVGIYAGIVLLAITFTALPIAFVPFQTMFYWMTGTSKLAPPPKSTIQTGAQQLSMESLWQRSKAFYPEAEWVGMRYPQKPGDAIMFEVVDKGAPHEDAKSYLYLDAFSGDTLRVTHYDTGVPLGRKIYLYCIALHSGLVGGLAYQLFLLLGALGVPVMAYTGFSTYLRRKLRQPAKATMPLRLARKTVEADGICSFEFEDPKGKALPPFSAGSHIDVHLRPGLVRQYSLCNDPADTHRYMIAVLKDPASRGGSQAMHDLKEGDIVDICTPKNHFPLEHSARRSLLLAGGIGITPILCMAERLSNSGAEFDMHYCTRSRERTAFYNRIRTSRYAERVRFYFSEEPQGQRFDMQHALSKPEPGTHLYVCGPKGFIDAVVKTAAAQGWDESHVHREFFNGATISSEDDVPFDVKLASTGKVVHVPKGKTALAALTECGVDIQVSCAEGVCGTCLTRVLEGEPVHRDLFLTAEERAKKDRFLPCCSRSNGGTLVLDV